MHFFRRFYSFRALLVGAMLIINLCILPFIVLQVMVYVKGGYAVQFIDNAKSTASLISTQLSSHDVKRDRQELSRYLSDVVELGYLTFAQLLPHNDPVIVSLVEPSHEVNFQEDVEFAQHDDGIYFLSGPFFDSSGKLVGLYQFGFDESVTEYQMHDSIEKIIYYAVLFFSLSTLVIIYFSKIITKPIKTLRDTANEIVAGRSNLSLENDSNIIEIRNLTSSLERMYNDIRSNEIYVSEIMNNMADALIVIDENWCVHDMNWESQKLFKCMREEIVGKEFSNLFSIDLMTDMKDKIEKNRFDSLCFEWAGCQQRGICLYLELKLSIVTLNSGTFIVCSIRDMTVRKEIENTLLNAKRNAEQANSAKSSFLSTMSHELRTPLNAIIGYSDLLIEDAEALDNPSFSQDIKKIHASGSHLLNLINKILDLSKIEAGKMEVDVSPFIMGNLLEEILFTLDPLIDESGNVFHADDSIYNIEMETDAFKLKQIFINIMANAIKFTSNGSINLVLHKHENTYVEFAISDTGIGISHDDFNYLFDSFTQVDTRSNREFEGTGLGLTICKKFINLLGGDIRVESVKGKGTTFYFGLPVRYSGNLSNQNFT